jgi:hypothetical protein
VETIALVATAAALRAAPPRRNKPVAGKQMA